METARRKALLADLSLVAVTAIWGSTFVVNSLILADTPPLLFLLLRFGLGGIVLVLLARSRPRTPGLVKDSAVIGALLALGIAAQLVGQLHTSASKAAFVTGLSVPLTPLLGYLTTRRLPSRENLAGIVLAAIGFGVLTWPRGDLGMNPGDLLILVTAVTYAYLIVYLAEVAGRHDVRWFSAGQIVAAALFIGAARLLVTPFLDKVSWLAAEARPLPHGPGLWVAILWMSLMATVVTFLVQTWAQARMTATHAAIIFALEPVFTAIFAAFVLGERMAGKDWAGASLVLLGILVSELPSRK